MTTPKQQEPKAMTIPIPQSRFEQPTTGMWSPRTRDGKKTAQLSCPKCGDAASLCDHKIAADGTVTPSVMCNVCDYHESGLRLEGWVP